MWRKVLWVLTKDPLGLCDFVLGVGGPWGCVTLSGRWTLGLESPKLGRLSSVIKACLDSVALTLCP